MINVDVNWALVVIACMFMVMDIATGIIGALVNHDIDSCKMKTGLLHKCGFILAIMFGYMCELAMVNSGLGWYIPLGGAVSIYIIGTEIASNLENFARISPDFAEKKFMGLFKEIQEKFSKEVDDIGATD